MCKSTRAGERVDEKRDNIHQERQSDINWRLDLVRVAAAIAVVAGHVRTLLFEDYSSSGQKPLTAVFYLASSLGGEAVLVFFVLSGYWVGGGTLRATKGGYFSWRDFLARRLSRLWLVLIPALLLTLTCDVIGGRVNGETPYNSPGYYHTLIPVSVLHVSDLSTMLGNVVFLQEIYVPTFGTNTPLWSLSYEFWYYVIFAAITSGLHSQGVGWKRARSLLLGVASIFIVDSNVLRLAPLWLAGALVAWALQRFPNQASRLAVTLNRNGAVLPVTLLGCALVAAKLLSTEVSQALIGLTASITVLALHRPDSHQLGRRTLMRTLRRISVLANSSYSLYAIHLPIAVLMTAWLGPRPTARMKLDFASSAQYLLLLAVLIMIAAGFAQITEARTPKVRTVLQTMSLRRLRLSESARAVADVTPSSSDYLSGQDHVTP